MGVRMPRKVVVLVLTLAATGAALWLLPVRQVLSQQLERVLVENFPEVQEVEGTVRVGGTVRHSRFLRGDEVLVPPVARSDYAQLIDGGTIEVDGFTEGVLSLFGEVKGTVLKSGEVGALLLPLEDPVSEAFREEGLYAFPLEVTAPVTSPNAFLASRPVEQTLAFPRYRVLFYNTSDRTVGLRLFVYLTY